MPSGYLFYWHFKGTLISKFYFFINYLHLSGTKKYILSQILQIHKNTIIKREVKDL